MTEKLKIYIENSVICMYYQDEAPYLRDLTRKFWKEILPYYDAYISEAVLDELNATKGFKLLSKLESLVDSMKVIEVSNETLKLTDIYLSNRRLPRPEGLICSLWVGRKGPTATAL